MKDEVLVENTKLKEELDFSKIEKIVVIDDGLGISRFSMDAVKSVSVKKENSGKVLIVKYEWK